jgi:hypothetical protein
MPPPAQHSTLQSADEHLRAGGGNIHLAAVARDIANGPAYQRFGGNHQTRDPAARHMPGFTADRSFDLNAAL